MSAALDDGELGERLAARTLELIDVPSESREEAALAARVAGGLGSEKSLTRDEALAHLGRVLAGS